MSDALWVSPDALGGLVGNDTFHVDGKIGAGDAVGLRLREEIAMTLRRPLAPDASQATIRLARVADPELGDEGFRISQAGDGTIDITGPDATALLRGLYDMLRRRATGATMDAVCVPSQSVRMIDQWDQTDGSVERGYAGASIFYGRPSKLDNPDGSFGTVEELEDPFRGDWDRLTTYARALASVGINAISLNNVNVRGGAVRLITRPYLDRVAGIARLFESFGIRTFLCINWAAPRLIGGLATSDPLDPAVRAWWTEIADGIWNAIPGFGGFLVKADSEGEPGPYQYGRTHADGANMLAEAVAPHGGTIIWRTFVYNSRQDWRDRTTDRARAAYDAFKPLDGQFADNVVLQVKFGPIDFQTCEPLTPLIGGMTHTNLIVEFQITAEYLGHQIDVNYVVPQWLRMLDTETHAVDGDSRVRTIVRTMSPNPAIAGIAGVSNVGMDENWTGNKLAQANLYGFGRMAWDADLTAGDILDEWIAQTFPDADADIKGVIGGIMATSNQTYADYCAPLGVGFMVRPHLHYGPDVNGYEYDRWGTYHFADRDGVGVDRTQATGSGYTAQYPAPVAAMYEDIATCPDELLLFFHHVPYDHVLHDGTTVIQHIYDTHFEGLDMVDRYIEEWARLEGRIDQETFENVRDRLALQHENALAWRDQVNTYFYRMTKVPDAQGRTIYP